MIQAAELGVELSLLNKNNLTSILQNIMISADKSKLAQVKRVGWSGFILATSIQHIYIIDIYVCMRLC